MQRLRTLISRLRGSPRALLVTAVVAVLLAAAVLDVPGRLGDLAPAESPAARATPTPTVTTDPGRLINLKNADNAGLDRCTPGSAVLAQCGPAPALGDGTWLGGFPTRIEDLQGSVALVDFFSGSCINCRRDARYLTAWQELYGPAGLRIIGVHTPEFDFEKDVGQLGRTLKSLSIDFPVLQDQAFSTLTAYRSQVLPSKYLVDRSGTVRAITFGEGGYFRIEAQIRKLLTEKRPGVELPDPLKELDDGPDQPRRVARTPLRQRVRHRRRARHPLPAAAGPARGHLQLRRPVAGRPPGRLPPRGGRRAGQLPRSPGVPAGVRHRCPRRHRLGRDRAPHRGRRTPDVDGPLRGRPRGLRLLVRLGPA